MIVYILIFRFLDRTQEDKRFCAERGQAFSKFNRHLILLLIKNYISYSLLEVVNSCHIFKEFISYLYIRFCPAF